MIEKIISHYKILQKLGEGGMGVVYKAQDLKLDRFVALKFLPTHVGADEEEKKRFIHEAKAASALEHNHICNIHEIDETDDGQMFIVMACYEGETLNEKINRGPLKLSEAIDIAIHTAQGLARAHESNIVHRDIKPSNIMITKRGVVKIVDFGLAKLSKRTKLTKEGSTLGTVSYMSPEQTRGEKVDHRSDIWSLGTVLFEMITGQLPFKGDYEQAVVYSIVNEEPEPITALRTDVPVELERIVNKALVKSPDERYQSVIDMRVDLQRLTKDLDSGPKPSPKPKLNSEIQKEAGQSKGIFQRFKWVFLILLISIVTITVLAVTAYFVFIKKEKIEKVQSPGERPPIEKPEKSTLIETRWKNSIAVLPFTNLSSEKEQEYFCDGVTDDIITHISKIGDLKVISRTSIMLYKGSNKSLREIGQELGVATILEGSVRRAGNRVRIVSQLVDARTDEHIWADTYDRELKDIFAIQSDVAQNIAIALKAKLSPEEKEQIEQKPTDNLEAYDYYLQGRKYLERSSEENDLEIAIELFEKAVREDPAFAEAYASLSRQQSKMYWYGYDRSPERLARAKEAIDKALSLKPDEPLVRVANGYYYYYGFRDYARALDEFTFAQRREPGNALYYSSIAFIQRRLGKFEDALQNLKIALKYDPRSDFIAKEVGNTYMYLRMYKEAEGYYDRAISIAPDGAWNYQYKAWTHIFKTGSTESARQVLDNALKRVNTYDLIWNLTYIDIYDGRYQDALDRLASIQEEVYEVQTCYTPKEAIRGFIYELMEQPDQARTLYIGARTLLEKKASEWPDDARIHAELGKVYAHLGLRDEAIQEGETAVDLIPVSRDAMIGPTYLTDLAEIYTIVGDYEAAIDNIEYLLEIPAEWVGTHIGLLKVNPVWNPLRDHPRFQKLLEGGK